MKKGNIPTIIGIIILITGVVAGVFLIQSRQIFKLGASVEATPNNVRVTNITDSSFSITWTTQKPTVGFVSWGEKEDSSNRVESDEVGQESTTHSVTIRGLKSSTNYFFKINSAGTTYDNNGIAWSTETGNQLPPPAYINIISGSVLTPSGEPASNAIVYLYIGGGSPLSTITSPNGSWAIPISLLRKVDLSNYYALDETADVLEISVHGESEATSSLQIYASSAKPSPPIILGQTHDFKNLPPSKTGDMPKALFNLPESATHSSRFSTEDATPATAAKTVTLKSIDEGEVVTSIKPELFGEGPVGTEVTVTIESEVQTGTVKVGSSGTWKWSPPQNLEEGTHKVTLSWRDSGGVLRSITRTFIVQASEEPAFEATPSATPTQRPTATPQTSATPKSTSTPTPTATTKAAATSTATPMPSKTPSSAPTSTPASATVIPTPTSMPDAGSLTPSFMLSIMGVGLLLTSGFFALLAFKKY